ncbi:MAG: biotin transporter BioY [Ruminiclostridium sp.]
MTEKRIKTIDLVLIALFAAITAVLSQIAIPMPTGVPVTLQTFAVALCGYFLGAGKGAAALGVYLLIGAVGVPVYSGFKGGFQVLLGPTGGFIFGFIIMAFLCGLSFKKAAGTKLSPVLRIAMGVAGVAACHLLGTLQYMIVTNVNPEKAGIDFITSFLLVSAPYLIKDIISVVVAYLISIPLIRATAKVRTA